MNSKSVWFPNNVEPKPPHSHSLGFLNLPFILVWSCLPTFISSSHQLWYSSFFCCPLFSALPSDLHKRSHGVPQLWDWFKASRLAPHYPNEISSDWISGITRIIAFQEWMVGVGGIIVHWSESTDPWCKRMMLGQQTLSCWSLWLSLNGHASGSTIQLWTIVSFAGEIPCTSINHKFGNLIK